MNTQQPTDVFNIITNRIIEQLERGIIPWRTSWAESGHPQNLFTKRPTTAINTWLLASHNYAQNYFLTWNQIQAVGAKVKKDEKGAMVVYWQSPDNSTPEKPESVLRYYFVYNIAQIDHLPEILTIPFPPTITNQLCACDEIIERMPNCPTIKHRKQQPHYDVVKDRITLPPQGSFPSPEAYYYELFTLLINSTGHQFRLNRKEIVEFQLFSTSGMYLEKLTAEIGACYLMSVAGIVNKDFDTGETVIKGWIDALRDNNRLVVLASDQAKCATEYILNVQKYSKANVQKLQAVETP